MQERGLVVIEAMPHLRARQPREQFLQHVTEGELAVVERALPMRLDHHQPDQPRPRHDALAAERARRLVRLQPFAAERVAGRIEIEHGAAGEVSGVELEREAGCRRTHLRCAPPHRTPPGRRHAAGPPARTADDRAGCPTDRRNRASPATASRAALPSARYSPVKRPYRRSLKRPVPRLLRLRIAEGEFIRRRGAFDRMFRDLAAIAAAHAAAVLGEDHGPERR